MKYRTVTDLNVMPPCAQQAEPTYKISEVGGARLSPGLQGAVQAVRTLFSTQVLSPC